MKKILASLVILCLLPLFGVYADDIPNSYADAYQLHSDLTTAMLDAYESLTEAHDEGLEYDDPSSLAMILFLPFLSIDMAFTASLKEDAEASAALAAFAFFGITDAALTRQAPHDYIITYANPDELPVEMHCEFSPETGALRFTQYTDGALKQFQELVPLDGNRYALQSKHQRALVTYADGRLGGFIYSGIAQSLFGEGDTSYDVVRDGIYPDASGLNEAWVTERDDVQLCITLDGFTLTVKGEDFLLNKKDVTISR
ncbi:MAG: hypothetical protein FWF47_07275 [Clostridia bacterium]|nr:hypothetical protein [Clostridia bacterium]